MHVSIANPRWRGKRSRNSRRMRNPQYYVSGKRPMAWYNIFISSCLCKCQKYTCVITLEHWSLVSVVHIPSTFHYLAIIYNSIKCIANTFCNCMCLLHHIALCCFNGKVHLVFLFLFTKQMEVCRGASGVEYLISGIHYCADHSTDFYFPNTTIVHYPPTIFRLLAVEKKWLMLWIIHSFTH